MPSDLVSGESPLSGSWMVLLSCNFIWLKGKLALWGLLYKGTNPVYEDSALMT